MVPSSKLGSGDCDIAILPAGACARSTARTAAGLVATCPAAGAAISTINAPAMIAFCIGRPPAATQSHGYGGIWTGAIRYLALRSRTPVRAISGGKRGNNAGRGEDIGK